MKHNHNARPAKAAGTPTKGNAKPLANMPANNVGNMPVKLGAGKPTSIVNSSNGKASGSVGTVDNIGAHVNSTNYINTGQKAKLGSTMHGVGQVPAYLRNPKNPDTKSINT